MDFCFIRPHLFALALLPLVNFFVAGRDVGLVGEFSTGDVCVLFVVKLQNSILTINIFNGRLTQ
jgi:hypothetical protein